MKIYTLFSYLFFSFSLMAQPTIQFAEWYIDDDPGVGRANRIATNKGNAEWEINGLNTLRGMHIIGVRAKNEDGIWSTTYQSAFWVVEEDTNFNNQIEAEWYVDDDPGIGRANRLISNDSRFEWNLNLSDLEPGVHTLGLRAKNTDNKWTTSYQSVFWIFEDDASPVVRVEYEYQLPNGEIIPFSYNLPEPSFNAELNFEASTMNLSPGESYDLCFKAITLSGQESLERCTRVTLDQQTTSTGNQTKQNLISIWPNPTSYWIGLQLDPTVESTSISIINNIGQIVFQQEGEVISPLRITTSEWQAGFYSIFIKTSNGYIIKAFLKQ